MQNSTEEKKSKEENFFINIFWIFDKSKFVYLVIFKVFEDLDICMRKFVEFYLINMY